MRDGRADEIAQVFETGGQILAKVDSQDAALAIGENLKVPAGLSGFHDAEGVSLLGTCRSSASSQVICRNTPELGPPL